MTSFIQLLPQLGASRVNGRNRAAVCRNSFERNRRHVRQKSDERGGRPRSNAGRRDYRKDVWCEPA